MSGEFFQDELMVMTPRSVSSGKSAYDYAVAGGYDGNEEDFAQRMAFLMKSAVVGRIETINGVPSILLSGLITEGEYTAYYEVDGQLIEIGELSLGEIAPKTYTVNWVVDGKITQTTVEEGVVPTFSGSTDKASDGEYTYTFVGWTPEVVPATADATYTARYTQTANSPDNLLDDAGYKTGYRIKLSTGKEEAIAGVCCSGYMPINYGDTLYIKNITLHSTADYNAIVFYDNDGNLITGCATNFTITTQSNGVYSLYVHSNKITALNSNVKKFRFGCGSITADTVVTVNDPL